jgi:glycosyltransferase involved in cell wall biosynthesis
LNRLVVKKPGVLLVTTSPLLPLNAGGRIYTWGTTAPLADDFDYHLITLATAQELAEFESDRDSLTDRYHTVFKTFRLFPRPPLPGDRPRGDALRHLWFHTTNGLPLIDVSYYSPAVVDAARDLVGRGTIDVLEVDHAQMAFVRRFVDSVPAILVNHNIEGDLHPFWMTDRWSLPELVVWRLFASVSRRNTRRVEIRNEYGFSSKLFISEVDAARVSGACPKSVLPVPMQPGPRPSLNLSGPLVILWLGSFDWPPNLEGLRWFLDRVWPGLSRDEGPRFELHIVGSNPPSDVSAARTESVHVHGYVDDISDLKRRSDVLIAPLFSGSGVRVKVAEGLAAGLPVVATPKGMEGLTAVPGRDLLLADNAEAFASALLRLASEPELRRRLSDAAQDYVRSTHAPEMVARIKRDALLSALGSSTQPAR